MKVIWKRNYNIQKRLYVEGLYLNEAGFEVGKGISYTLNKQNKSAMIKLSKRDDANRVTHNISRSGKTVPTIGIRNKIVENFIDGNSNMEMIVFNGVIVLITRDITNKNIALCEALLTHNKCLKENIKQIFKSLVELGVIEDDIFLQEAALLSIENISINKVAKEIPRRILINLKKTLRKNLYKNTNSKNNLVGLSSNSFILCCIIEIKQGNIDDEDESDDLLGNFLSDNYNQIVGCSARLKSVIKQRIQLGRKSVVCRNIFNISLEHYVAKNIDFKDKITSILTYKKRLFYFGVIVQVKIIHLGKIFLETRKQINTLSPPISLNIRLKCLM